MTGEPHYNLASPRIGRGPNNGNSWPKNSNNESNNIITSGNENNNNRSMQSEVSSLILTRPINNNNNNDAMVTAQQQGDNSTEEQVMGEENSYLENPPTENVSSDIVENEIVHSEIMDREMLMEHQHQNNIPTNNQSREHPHVNNPTIISNTIISRRSKDQDTMANPSGRNQNNNVLSSSNHSNNTTSSKNSLSQNEINMRHLSSNFSNRKNQIGLGNLFANTNFSNSFENSFGRLRGGPNPGSNGDAYPARTPQQNHSSSASSCASKNSSTSKNSANSSNRCNIPAKNMFSSYNGVSGESYNSGHHHVVGGKKSCDFSTGMSASSVGGNSSLTPTNLVLTDVASNFAAGLKNNATSLNTKFHNANANVIFPHNNPNSSVERKFFIGENQHPGNALNTENTTLPTRRSSNQMNLNNNANNANTILPSYTRRHLSPSPQPALKLPRNNFVVRNSSENKQGNGFLFDNGNNQALVGSGGHLELNAGGQQLNLPRRLRAPSPPPNAGNLNINLPMNGSIPSPTSQQGAAPLWGGIQLGKEIKNPDENTCASSSSCQPPHAERSSRLKIRAPSPPPFADFLGRLSPGGVV